VSKVSARTGLGSLATGAVTAIALAVQAGLAAIVGVIIARELGRTAETDGFFAAYGVFVVLALAATVIRLVVLPPLARARDERRLGSETAAWALALTLLSTPLLLVGILAARPLAALLTGFGPEAAREAAAETLPLMLLAAAGQLYAGLAASALAALDSYVVAALAYIAGSAIGLAFILLRIDEDGISAVAVGMALNGLVAAAVQLVVLAARARRAAMPSSAVRPAGTTLWKRLTTVAAGIALPLALQAVYLICLPFAAREGVGAVTSFGYAYLAGSAVVGVCGSSLGLVTSVPLTRVADLDGERVARHVVSTSWPAVIAVGATAGIFLLTGRRLVSVALGPGYDDRVGEELGRLIGAFAPWMIVTIGFSVTLPLLFVAGRVRRLPALAVIVLLAQLPLALLGQTVGGLTGLAFALALTAALALAAMLHILRAARATLVGLAGACALVGAVTFASFVPAGLVLPAGAAALVGVLLYVGVLAVTRPSGLRASLRYLRTL